MNITIWRLASIDDGREERQTLLNVGAAKHSRCCGVSLSNVYMENKESHQLMPLMIGRQPSPTEMVGSIGRPRERRPEKNLRDRIARIGVDVAALYGPGVAPASVHFHIKEIMHFISCCGST